MPELDLVDNDIIFKICCFDLLVGFAALFDAGASPNRLVVAEYVLKKKMSRSSRLNDKSACLKRLTAFLEWSAGLEPTDDEISLAAEIEGLAQQQNIAFDSGESILLAVLLSRLARRLFTGDKRAIEGLWPLSQSLNKEDAVSSRIVCFEQIMLSLLEKLGAEELARRVCQESGADTTAAICCGCAGRQVDAAGITEGFQSYIADLRKRCGPVLVA